MDMEITKTYYKLIIGTIVIKERFMLSYWDSNHARSTTSTSLKAICHFRRLSKFSGSFPLKQKKAISFFCEMRKRVPQILEKCANKTLTETYSFSFNGPEKKKQASLQNNYEFCKVKILHCLDKILKTIFRVNNSLPLMLH